jgi:phosphoadenosine phosphosulfate reductase
LEVLQMVSPMLSETCAQSSRLEEATPQEILRWAVETYYPKLTMATAFGAEGCVILAMLAEIEPRVRVFNLDTGYQFPETLALRERIRQRYGIEVELIRPNETVEQMERRFGGPIYHTQPQECCRLRKVEPLKRALQGYNAWITGIRREQTAVRAKANVVGWDERFQLVKINPLLNWTKADVWRYIRLHDVPYNSLHDQGYPSIGCWPCTRPVLPGQDDRAGRWAGLGRVECGIHLSR